jgi:hypothetical protein
LRREQKGIKEQYEDNVEQRAQFSALRGLLQVKLQVLKEARETEMMSDNSLAAMGFGGADRMSFD